MPPLCLATSVLVVAQLARESHTDRQYVAVGERNRKQAVREWLAGAVNAWGVVAEKRGESKRDHVNVIAHGQDCPCHWRRKCLRYERWLAGAVLDSWYG